ncbi:hypothetical protein [Sinomonas sp. G460-2]|uniref:hypothetical protein n=1 Tax=Sinomonas sp. G460-2 TaxID=3393464 RepID=UPI0039EE5C09
MEPDPGRQHSDDGQWWWDGQRWLPALSLDGRWRFDGRAWRRNSQWREPSRAVLITGGIWAAALALWAPVLMMVLPAPSGVLDTGEETVLIAVFVVVVLLATVATGFAVGLATQLRWLWLASVVGAGAQMVGYVASMVLSDAPSADDFAAVGSIMLTGPVLLGITALLWAGAGLGRLATAIRRRMVRRTPLA